MGKPFPFFIKYRHARHSGVIPFPLRFIVGRQYMGSAIVKIEIAIIRILDDQLARAVDKTFFYLEVAIIKVVFKRCRLYRADFFCIESQMISHRAMAKESRDLTLCKMSRILGFVK
ncbi:hypothetical protein H5A35_01070 [Pectobacterium brasiliense]|uniref:hypothetical protein n=1 Tax=Pectobacterium brasiliense TaxID=180957 RepID=UPI0019690DEB|nr:hypothetical protein [Pectobacterium brasiliense]MBN3205997.1 hypothetical protein [Pectobacterium brasiliense]